MKFNLLILLVFISMNTLLANDYLDQLSEEEAKAYYWDSKEAHINQSKVPEAWNSKSAVILHNQIDIESLKRKVKREVFFTKSMLSHLRIKLQDKAAIENYSEFNFTPFKDNSGTKQVHYWGIKIIKANGKTVVIDVENEQVEEKNNSVVTYKVAIPDLEEGDILDVYRYLSERRTAYNPIHFYDKMTLQHGYPVVRFDYNVVTDNSFQFAFRSNNGAPELEHKVLEDNITKYWFSAEDMEESKAENWYYPYLDNPYIEFYLRQKGYYLHEDYIKNYDKDDIETSLRNTFSADRNTKNEISEFERFLKKKGIQTTSSSDFLERYYYYTRHKFLNMDVIYKLYNNKRQGTTDLEDQNFLNHMIGAADKLDLKYHILLAQARDEGQIEDAIIPNYWIQVVRIETKKQDYYFYAPSNYSMFGIVPMTIEGATVYSGSSSSGRANDMELETFDLPVSSHEDNLTDHKIIADLTNGLDEPVEVSTTMDIVGRGIFYYKDEVLDYFDFIIEENKYYGTKLWGDLNDSKLDAKRRPKLEQHQADFLKARDEMLTGMAKHDFETDKINFKDAEVLSNGNWHKAENLKFRYDFDVEEGLLKKAGPNYILEAGKFVGGQVEISEEEKERSENIHMPFARSFNYDIEIKIPEGYTVEGIEKFNKSVENATGGLVSSGKVVGSTVQLKFYKYYKNNYEKVKNWPEMIKFLDAGYQFTQEKLLLRKG